MGEGFADAGGVPTLNDLRKVEGGLEMLWYGGKDIYQNLGMMLSEKQQLFLNSLFWKSFINFYNFSNGRFTFYRDGNVIKLFYQYNTTDYDYPILVSAPDSEGYPSVVSMYTMTFNLSDYKVNNVQQSNGSEGLLEYAWNSPLARWLVPDKLSVSIGGDLAFGLGVGAQPVNFTILTRGKDPGLYLTPTFNATAGITAKAEGSINFSVGYYTGDPRNITASMLMGTTHAIQLSIKALEGASVGGSWTPADNYGNRFINGSFGLGVGVGFSLEYQYQYTPGYGPLWQW